MRCPKCQTTNTAGSRFCSQCGHDLTGDRPIGIRWHLMVIAAVCVMTAVWWLAHHRTVQNRADPEKAPGRTYADFETRKETIHAKRGDTIASPAAKNPRMVVPLGTLVIEDITGKPKFRSVVPIVDAGWFALPKSQALGGYRWHLRLNKDESVPIIGSVSRDPDMVGIWQTALPPPATGPLLARWNEAMPLDWFSLDANNDLKRMHLSGCEGLGYFIRCDLPYGVSGPGVFFQGDAVVGWTFDTGTDGAFLWNGLPGTDLAVEVRLEDDYRLTFADSREEKWLLALAEDKGNDLRQLDTLVDAYQYPRKLTDSQLPPHLHPARIMEFLQNMVSDLAAAGYGSDVVNRFDRQTLLEIHNPALVIQVAELTGQIYGNDAAIQTIEWVKAYLSLSSTESRRLNKVHREFYNRLLGELSARGDWLSVAQRLSAARTEFPDDPQLHLFAVRLAIADGDWDNAEQLLSERSFPEELSSLVVELQSEIDRLKAFEGKIVVRFHPGSKNIRVTAELNGELVQSFLIDTGASMVTIPHSTALRLGIPHNSGSPVRTVYTAGGPVEAREVTIDEITLNGWSVRQVGALVLDIPGRSDLGLLGLNYLNRFDMDLQAEKGLLSLTPK